MTATWGSDDSPEPALPWQIGDALGERLLGHQKAPSLHGGVGRAAVPDGACHRDHEICSSYQSLYCQFSLGPAHSPSNPSPVA